MKIAILVLLALALAVFPGCARKNSTNWQSVKNPEVTAQLKSFVAEKEREANVNSPTNPPEFKKFYAAAERGDWITVSNIFVNFKKRAPQYEHSGKSDERLHGTAWQTVIETWGSLDAVFEGGDKYAAIYANGIIDSIPAGSIYFGGTDPGRFLITGMQKSQANGDPFFTITQNALADTTYLSYLRGLYDDRIYIPTAADAQKAFRDYTKDAQERMQKNQLKQGEDVTTDANGRVQIQGQIAVMEINALIARTIFDQNSNRQFYVEESFPLDWMYPNLEPNGIIMKLDRTPLVELSDEIVQRDEDYWSNLMSPMIGNWLNPDTPLGDVTDFADKIYAKKDFTGFTGDKEFAQNEYFKKTFSKERSSIAGLYAWRAQHATNAEEKKRMNDAADFAFRQSIALCPYSPEGVFRYANMLMTENRFSDALLVAEEAAKMPQMKGADGASVRDLARQLQRMAK